MVDRWVAWVPGESMRLFFCFQGYWAIVNLVHLVIRERYGYSNQAVVDQAVGASPRGATLAAEVGLCPEFGVARRSRLSIRATPSALSLEKMTSCIYPPAYVTVHLDRTPSQRVRSGQLAQMPAAGHHRAARGQARNRPS